MIKNKDFIDMTNRTYYLDVIRVSAIILVIALHCVSDISVGLKFYGKNSWFASIAINGLCRAGVPLFLMISGYLSLDNKDTEDIANYYKKRFSRIIPSLIIWNIIYYLFFTIYKNESFSFQTFFGRLINNGNAYHMWYVYTLLGIYLISPFLRMLVVRLRTNGLIVFFLVTIISSTIIPFINIISPVYIYLFDPLVNGYIGFYILGYILGKCTISEKYEYLIYLAGIIGYAINLTGNIIFSSHSKINLVFNYGYALPTYLIASALFVFCKYHMNNIGQTVFKKMITRISTISFGIYWIHVAILIITQKFFPNTLSPSSIIILRFTITLIISASVMTIVKKIPVINKLLM